MTTVVALSLADERPSKKHARSPEDSWLEILSSSSLTSEQVSLIIDTIRSHLPQSLELHRMLVLLLTNYSTNTQVDQVPNWGSDLMGSMDEEL